jgi:hypothetical protein
MGERDEDILISGDADGIPMRHGSGDAVAAEFAVRCSGDCDGDVARNAVG